MKRTDPDDIKLAEMLKKDAYQATDNEWFTPRVMNRLPEKRHSAKWLKTLVYTLALAGVIGCWMWYSSTQDTSVITVRDVLSYACMLCSSIAVACYAIVDFMKSE